jgi:hypothetical protein
VRSCDVAASLFVRGLPFSTDEFFAGIREWSWRASSS